jgi:hypothetical protein
MVNYTCPTCFKKFNKKDSFIKHTERKKKPCLGFLPNFTNSTKNLPKITELVKKPENTCEYCSKNFSTIYTLNRHLNGRCKIKKSLDEVNDKNNKEYLIKLEDQSKKIEEQSKEMKELYKMIEELRKQKTTNITINNTDNSTKTNVNNINLMAHGSEDLGKIDTKTILKYLCSDKFESIIPNVVKEIFRNKDRPEFLNFEVTDLARNKSRFYNGNDWEVGDADDGILKVFENTNSRILEPFDKENIENTVEMIRKDKELYPNYKTIHYGRNFCGKLFSEDKEYIDHKDKICLVHQR